MLQQQGGHRDRDRVQVPSAEAPGCRLRDKIQVGVRLFQMSNLNDLFSNLFIFWRTKCKRKRACVNGRSLYLNIYII